MVQVRGNKTLNSTVALRMESKMNFLEGTGLGPCRTVRAKENNPGTSGATAGIAGSDRRGTHLWSRPTWPHIFTYTKTAEERIPGILEVENLREGQEQRDLALSGSSAPRTATLSGKD